jgi:phage-related protein
MNRVEFIKNDVYNFLLSFEDDLVAKILGLLELLDEFGVRLGPPKLKKINNDIYELRIVGKVQIRIFCTFTSNKIIILHAFIKKSQKIQQKELVTAINRLKYLH